MKLTKTQEGILNAEEVVGGAISNICGATFFTRRYSVEKLNTAVNTVVRINDAFRLHFVSCPAYICKLCFCIYCYSKP